MKLNLFLLVFTSSFAFQNALIRSEICESFCDDTGIYLGISACNSLVPYCCGDCKDRYCCNEYDMRLDQSKCSKKQNDKIQTEQPKPIVQTSSETSQVRVAESLLDSGISTLLKIIGLIIGVCALLCCPLLCLFCFRGFFTNCSKNSAEDNKSAGSLKKRLASWLGIKKVNEFKSSQSSNAIYANVQQHEEIFENQYQSNIAIDVNVQDQRETQTSYTEYHEFTEIKRAEI